jgi:hypothetical protein
MKAVIDLPAAPRPPRPVAAVAAVLVLLFLGMSLVAAREVAVRCQTTENCLGMGSGQCLGFGHGSAMGFGGQNVTRRSDNQVQFVARQVCRSTADPRDGLGAVAVIVGSSRIGFAARCLVRGLRPLDRTSRPLASAY